jgi:hypothetical protein
MKQKNLEEMISNRIIFRAERLLRGIKTSEDNIDNNVDNMKDYTKSYLAMRKDYPNLEKLKQYDVVLKYTLMCSIIGLVNQLKICRNYLDECYHIEKEVKENGK